MSDRRLKDIESIFTELIVKFIIIEEIIHIKKSILAHIANVLGAYAVRMFDTETPSLDFSN